MSNTQNKTKISDLLGTCLVTMIGILIGTAVMYFSLNEYCARKHIIDHGVKTEATVLDAMEIRRSRIGAKTTHYRLDLSFTEPRDAPSAFSPGSMITESVVPKCRLPI